MLASLDQKSTGIFAQKMAPIWANFLGLWKFFQIGIFSQPPNTAATRELRRTPPFQHGFHNPVSTGRIGPKFPGTGLLKLPWTVSHFSLYNTPCFSICFFLCRAKKKKLWKTSDKVGERWASEKLIKRQYFTLFFTQLSRHAVELFSCEWHKFVSLQSDETGMYRHHSCNCILQ